MTDEEKWWRDREVIDSAVRFLARHALGLDTSSAPFRNHYVAVPGTEENGAWILMVRDGLAKQFDETVSTRTYRLTPQGILYTTRLLEIERLRALIAEAKKS